MEPDSPFACVLCGDAGGRAVAPEAVVALRRCRACGLVQRHPVPSEEEVRALYEEESLYADQLLRDEAAFVARDREVLAALAARGASGPLLDVGAGAGLLLRAARERGWEAVGLELSEPNARAIRAALDATVHTADLDGAPLAPESFGVVTLSHTLEHVRDPVGALARARELLRPGGLVYVAVPNWAAATRVVAGGHVAWVNREHVTYFDRRTLARAFEAAGLVPVASEARPFLGVQHPFAIAVVRRLGLEGAVRRFLRLEDRGLADLLADDVRLACPPWRFRAVVGAAHVGLGLWPERLLCRVGRGQELRGVAARPA